MRESRSDEPLSGSGFGSRQRGTGWSRLREIAISTFIVCAMLIAVTWSMPDSALKRAMTPVLLPLAAPSGLDQSWRMFSPNPPKKVSEVLVVVAVDGEKRKWEFESDHSILRSFHWDRWRKVKEQLMADPKGRSQFADWVIRQLTSPGERVERVSIVMFTTTLAGPGSDAPVTKQSSVLYDRKYSSTR